ncbi:MAG: polysaccharide deacetylase family protein [Ilumatobacteraceae bacterium]|jgi:predicted glycoside hydrolase/deacetylase ChbG (UPF0249 family)
MSSQRVVVHVDDVGMCHGANVAFAELSRSGAVSAGSVMVPCPWSSEVLEWAAGDPGLDLGVHLTLNAEQDHYRWAPLTDRSEAAGMVDADGYMWRRVAAVREHAHPDAVEGEWRAQIDRALAAGVDVTHLDAHMGSSLAPEFCARYVALGVEYRLPVLLTATLSAYGPNKHLAGVSEEVFAEFVAQATSAGMPVFDRVLETDFSRARGTEPDYPAMLASADDELVYCAFHPCRPGPGEIEEIEPDQHHVRTDEYRVFSDPQWTSWLESAEFEVIGMRGLRDAWRSEST